MNKGERIWKSLLDPVRHHIAATEWLLLYTISKRSRTAAQIQGEMTTLWRKINTVAPSFYLVFLNNSDGHNWTALSLEQELVRFYEIGIVQHDDDKWSLTKKGITVLNEWRPRIQKIIPLLNF